MTNLETQMARLHEICQQQGTRPRFDDVLPACLHIVRGAVVHRWAQFTPTVDADDITQKVLLRAFQQWQFLSFENAHKLVAWMTVCAHNLIRDQMRHETCVRMETILPERDYEHADPQEVEREVLSRLAWRATRQLAYTIANGQVLVELAEGDTDFPTLYASGTLGQTHSAVKARVFRARQRLLELTSEWRETPL